MNKMVLIVVTLGVSLVPALRGDDFGSAVNATSMAVFGHSLNAVEPGSAVGIAASEAANHSSIASKIAEDMKREQEIRDAYQKGLDDGDAVVTRNHGIVPLYPVTR